MSSSKCEICEKKPAEYSCKICGRRVCSDDFDFGKNRCLVCNEAICKICGEHLSIGVCKYCGRVGCEKCLIQVTLIDYVCIDCYRKGSR